LNLTELLMDKARIYAEKPAVVFADRSYSYGHLSQSVKEHAALLSHLGVRKGDRVALQLPKGMEFIYLHLAVLSLGAITLPLNPAYTDSGD